MVCAPYRITCSDLFPKDSFDYSAAVMAIKNTIKLDTSKSISDYFETSSMPSLPDAPQPKALTWSPAVAVEKPAEQAVVAHGLKRSFSATVPVVPSHGSTLAVLDNAPVVESIAAETKQSLPATPQCIPAPLTPLGMVSPCTPSGIACPGTPPTPSKRRTIDMLG
eukprot:463351-Lingulodinium_polyedra.AAC.1